MKIYSVLTTADRMGDIPHSEVKIFATLDKANEYAKSEIENIAEDFKLNDCEYELTEEFLENDCYNGFIEYDGETYSIVVSENELHIINV